MFARSFDADGAPIGNEFLVHTATTGVQSTDFDAVGHDGRGSFVIVWRSVGNQFTASGSTPRARAGGWSSS